jgi:hypothetical protein
MSLPDITLTVQVPVILFRDSINLLLNLNRDLLWSQGECALKSAVSWIHRVQAGRGKDVRRLTRHAEQVSAEGESGLRASWSPAKTSEPFEQTLFNLSGFLGSEPILLEKGAL